MTYSYRNGLGKPKAANQVFSEILAFSTSRAKDPPSRTYIWSSILAIHQLATSSPRAIDFMVCAFAEATKLFPETVSNEYGNGPGAGFEALRWWLIDEANCFNSVEFPNRAGILDPNDKSNIVLWKEEVDDRLDAVLDRIQECGAEKAKIMISMAIASRCFALDVVRESGGDHVAGLINGGIKRDPCWTKADFIASCILLRGCARSLVGVLGSGQDQLQQWNIDFKSFLVQNENTGDNDFVVKQHAAVCSPSLGILVAL